MFLHPMHIFNKDLEYEMRCGRIFQEERKRQNAKWRKKKQKNLIHVSGWYYLLGKHKIVIFFHTNKLY